MSSEGIADIEVAWAALEREAQRVAGLPVRQMFELEPGRFEMFSCEAAGLLLDYSRHHVDAGVMQRLYDLADRANLRDWIAAMYRGDAINNSESRAVLHVALRQRQGDGVGGADIEEMVLHERRRLLDFATAVREGRICGSSRQAFRTVVNIGIGGSDLGPAMAVEALKSFQVGAPRVLYASNVDGCTLADHLQNADPATTLFIIASKTFATQETMANAGFARAWLRDRLEEEAIPAHFAAVSVNRQAMDAFGVHPDHRFQMWDWVGGRYSIWSSIGLSVAIAIGAENFCAMLEGAREVDKHFASAPWQRNLPVLMGLLGIWNINLMSLPTLAVLPYDSRLSRFPAFLQQLDMESNGKRVGRDGVPLRRATAPIVWGEPGNNAQHSFFQMLHQGTPRAALDFLLPANSSCGNDAQHVLAIANCLAQADVFMRGQSGSAVPEYKVHEGDRPASLLVFEKLDPRTLGVLIAIYEHKVFVQSVLWGINAFDQWGVELGKKVASGVLGWLSGDFDPRAVPPSMRGTIAAIRSRRSGR
ncbi:MAG: glucose-6-phosphate isomerase [Steroidobacteraceae bacterium]